MTKSLILKLCLISTDILSFYLIYYCSGVIIFDFDFAWINGNFNLAIVLFPFVKVTLNYIFKNYNHLWQFGVKDQFFRLISVIICIDIIIILTYHFYQLDNIFNVLVLTLFLELVYYYGIRLSIAILLSYYYRSKNAPKNGNRTLIVGSGSAANIISLEISANPQLNYLIVAYIDDDPNKIGKIFNGQKIYGPIEKINEVIKEKGIKKIIIAMPSAGQNRIQEIVTKINYKDIDVNIVPPMATFLKNKLSYTIRKVDISDLLGRNVVVFEPTGIDQLLVNKTVMVTGGGGSIGSELCRQIVKFKPKKLIIFDIYENGVYDLQTYFQIYFTKNPELFKPDIIGIIGSIRDEIRLTEVIKENKIDIIFHAAAHKHVPLMDFNPTEAIKNNVLGTYNLVKIATENNVKKFVAISTDKAVNPTNVMGASKRFAELIIESFQKQSSKTNFSMVRFGNVLGSNGSVIPLFEKQIEAGGPITVTSEEINRYFMTIEEACALVLQSGAFSNGGEKFILDMGEPIKIIDLAKNLIKLSGLELDKDIKIEVTGLRPGEKLFEELLLDKTKAKKTINEKIYIEEMESDFDLAKIEEIINRLVTISNDPKKILAYLNIIELERFKK